MRARHVALVLLLAACKGGDAGTLDPCESCEAIGPSTRFARLTHAQYENAVRDLLYLDARPRVAEGFIGDPLSEGGFDNDADQLQVGDDLWIDYQRAAESLAGDVISDADLYARVVPEDPRAGRHGVDFEAQIEAESGEVSATTGRAGSQGYNLWARGSLSATFTLPESGEYRVSTNVWADQAGPDLAQMQLLVDGSAVTEQDVTAIAHSSAETVSVTLSLGAGAHSIGVAFLNDYNRDGQDRNLHVDWLRVEGAAPPYEGPLPDEDTAEAWIRRMGARTHRRPLSEEQVDQYVELWRAGSGLELTGDPFRDGVYTVLVGMLQSPWFVYRTELSTAQDDLGRIELDSWDLASKLSFAVMHSMPDEALLSAAEDGSLRTDEGFATQLDRLLASSESVEVIDHFHHQLLVLDAYANIYKDGEVFPGWSPRVNSAMQTEALLFTRSIVTEDDSLRDLFTAPRSHVNRDLAPIYGLAVDSDTFVPVDLDEAERAGLLTLSGFLAAQAHASEIDSIHRGAFVNLRFLCSDLPPPPNVIPPLPEPVPGQTNRERVEAHTGLGTCGGACHGTFINPVGFALENYDALGRWRDTDIGQPVDASGTFAFASGERSWQTPAEFAALVGESENMHTCMTRHWMRYLHGREASVQDEVVIGDVAERSRTQDLAVKQIMRELLLADAFRYRSPEVAP